MRLSTTNLRNTRNVDAIALSKHAAAFFRMLHTICLLLTMLLPKKLTAVYKMCVLGPLVKLNHAEFHGI